MAAAGAPEIAYRRFTRIGVAAEPAPVPPAPARGARAVATAPLPGSLPAAANTTEPVTAASLFPLLASALPEAAEIGIPPHWHAPPGAPGEPQAGGSAGAVKAVPIAVLPPPGNALTPPSNPPPPSALSRQAVRPALPPAVQHAAGQGDDRADAGQNAAPASPRPAPPSALAMPAAALPAASAGAWAPVYPGATPSGRLPGFASPPAPLAPQAGEAAPQASGGLSELLCFRPPAASGAVAPPAVHGLLSVISAPMGVAAAPAGAQAGQGPLAALLAPPPATARPRNGSDSGVWRHLAAPPPAPPVERPAESSHPPVFGWPFSQRGAAFLPDLLRRL